MSDRPHLGQEPVAWDEPSKSGKGATCAPGLLAPDQSVIWLSWIGCRHRLLIVSACLSRRELSHAHSLLQRGCPVLLNLGSIDRHVEALERCAGDAPIFIVDFVNSAPQDLVPVKIGIAIQGV